MVKPFGVNGLIQTPPPAIGSIGRPVESIAAGGAQPRLVGTSSIDDVATKVEGILPGSSAVVERKGIRGLIPYIMQNPKKSAAAATIIALGSIQGYQELAELAASHPVQAVRDWASSIIQGVDDINAKAGLGTSTPDEDGKVADIEVTDIASYYAMVAAGREKYESAAAAVGGRARLNALDEWRALDDDLKRVVLNSYA